MTAYVFAALGAAYFGWLCLKDRTREMTPACDAWGHTSREQTAQDGCGCHMCAADRWDRTPTKKRKDADRPQ